MKLKTLALAAALALPLAAFADGNNPFAGGYVGAGLGFVSNTYNIRHSSSTTVNSGTDQEMTDSSGHSIDAGKIGFAGKFFGGYNFAVSDNLLVGIEANYQMSSAKANHNDYDSFDSSSAKDNVTENEYIKISGSYGLGVNVGYLFNQNNMVFITVGYQRAKLKANESVTYSDSTSTQTILGEGFSKSLNGVRLGLGAQQSLSDNLSLREDMTYDIYKTYSMSSTDKPEPGMVITTSHQLKPKALTAAVDLVYTF